MDFIQCLGSFQLNQQCVLDEKIRGVVSDKETSLMDWDPPLLLNLQARSAKLVGKGILIDLLQEATAEDVAHGVGTSTIPG